MCPVDQPRVPLLGVLGVEEIVHGAGVECLADGVLALHQETPDLAAFRGAQQLDSRNDPWSALGERVHGSFPRL